MLSPQTGESHAPRPCAAGRPPTPRICPQALLQRSDFPKMILRGRLRAASSYRVPDVWPAGCRSSFQPAFHGLIVGEPSLPEHASFKDPGIRFDLIETEKALSRVAVSAQFVMKERSRGAGATRASAGLRMIVRSTPPERARFHDRSNWPLRPIRPNARSVLMNCAIRNAALPLIARST